MSKLLGMGIAIICCHQKQDRLPDINPGEMEWLDSEDRPVPEIIWNSIYWPSDTKVAIVRIYFHVHMGDGNSQYRYADAITIDRKVVVESYLIYDIYKHWEHLVNAAPMVI
jgi:hypothetical protein